MEKKGGGKHEVRKLHIFNNEDVRNRRRRGQACSKAWLCRPNRSLLCNTSSRIEHTQCSWQTRAAAFASRVIPLDLRKRLLWKQGPGLFVQLQILNSFTFLGLYAKYASLSPRNVYPTPPLSSFACVIRFPFSCFPFTSVVQYLCRPETSRIDYSEDSLSALFSLNRLSQPAMTVQGKNH